MGAVWPADPLGHQVKDIGNDPLIVSDLFDLVQ